MDSPHFLRKHYRGSTRLSNAALEPTRVSGFLIPFSAAKKSGKIVRLMRFGGLTTLFRLGPRRLWQLFYHLPSFLKLFWRLLKDRRVPIRPKLLLVLLLAYIVAPVDLLPDIFLGLGQADDLLVLFLGLQAFVRLCPKEIVREHVQAIAAGG